MKSYLLKTDQTGKSYYILDKMENSALIGHLFMAFGIGLVITWLVLDYITLNLFYKDIYLNWCCMGIHIHHLYVGILLLLFFPLFSRVKTTKWQIIFIFFMGIGMGLIISDLFIHYVLKIVPFTLIC